MQREEDQIYIPKPYQPQQEKTFYDKFSIHSWTFRISTLDVIVFIITVITLVVLQTAFVTENMSDDDKEIYSWDCVLYYFGAKHSPSIRYRFQFHRLLLPALLHGSPMHIIGNLVAQIYFGVVQEAQFGGKRLAIVYICGAVAGDLLSCVVFRDQIAVGASAAIFALVGLELAYFLACFPRIETKRIVPFFFVFPMLMISFFDSEPNVDIAGHLGGFIAGVLLGAAYAFEDSRMSETKKRVFSQFFYLLFILFLILCVVILYTFELEDERICQKK